MSLLDDLLRLFGTNRTRLRWRLRSLKERRARSERAEANQALVGKYANKVCPKCSHPAGRDEEICTRCGQKLGSLFFQRLARSFDGVIPEGFPAVSFVFLVICVAMYFVVAKLTAVGMDVTGDSEGVVFHDVLVRLGGNVPTMTVELHQWWRLVAYAFIHSGGLMHLGMNGIVIWQAGSLLEERFGRSRVIVCMVATGIGGGIASAAWHLHQDAGMIVSAGASGIAFGEMGLLLVHAVKTRDAWSRAIRKRLVPLVLLNVIISFVPGIDGAAHAGGAVMGAFLALVMTDTHVARRRHDALWRVLALASIATVIYAGVMTATHPATSVYWIFGAPR